MKKLTALTMTLVMAVSLAACGGKAQSVTYTMEQDNEGLKMTDTMTLNAKGDKVQKMEETIALDMTGFDDDTQTLMTEAYQAVDGVECTGSAADGVYTIAITIDTTGDAVSKLAEQGLLQVDGGTNGISLEKTGEALEAGGYTKAE